MESLRLIGYWRNAEHPEYPDPAALVDDSWDPEERQIVWFHLAGGSMIRAFMGLSPCRMCDERNGAVEFTDGTYAWPEGLAHYVYDHGVRLPKAFVDHAIRQQELLEARGAELTWWLDNVG